MNSEPLKPERAGAPSVSKVMVILYAVSILFYYLLNVAAAMYYRSGGIWLILIAVELLGSFLVIALLTAGVFVKKVPALYGVGLLVLSFGWTSSALGFIFGTGGPMRSVAVSTLISLTVCSNLILPAVHYFLRGRGIGEVIKNVFTGLYLATAFLSFVYTLSVYAVYLSRGYAATVEFIVQIIMACIGFIPTVFLSVATFAFTAKKR